ncbi:50S ribosomal protein L25/general stress protein Ctc [Fundidesulfovibrio soli]|uniref:50S ribosomal protein L25/general stress protein Ctc n=1 Tax=Fundidesulfovibrio soli TaxID=2922716 RepID=UPI001FB01B63|nr:50S ribosomal protein L25/general stress protein Ctc [Fundidesulfovibrio soli]
MKEQLSLTVQGRAERGKGPNSRLRAQKMVPGVYYDDKGVNIPVVVADLPFRKVFQKVGSSRVFDLIIDHDGKTETHPSLIWVVDAHPYKNQIDHVDFYGVDPTKQIHVRVEVEVKGKPKGVVVGGKLEIYHEDLEVVCLPANIPDKIVIDVAGLEINQAIQIKDVVLPEGVKAVFDSNFAVVAVISPTAEAEGEGGK